MSPSNIINDTAHDLVQSQITCPRLHSRGLRDLSRNVELFTFAISEIDDVVMPRSRIAWVSATAGDPALVNVVVAERAGIYIANCHSALEISLDRDWTWGIAGHILQFAGFLSLGTVVCDCIASQRTSHAGNGH